jgi:hypothetical protein
MVSCKGMPCVVNRIVYEVRDSSFHHRPKLWAKYRSEAMVVPEVMARTLRALFSDCDMAPFLTQFAQSNSVEC